MMRRLGRDESRPTREKALVIGPAEPFRWGARGSGAGGEAPDLNVRVREPARASRKSF